MRIGAIEWLCLAAGLGALTMAVSGQQELPGTFSEVLEVRVVNVEVVVTDREGNRVQGLGASDFRLVVDGEEVPVEYFTEVRGGSAVASSGEEGAPRRVPSLDPGEGVGTSYLVFIDEYFAISRDRDRILEKLREQLPMLGPEDRMAVVAFDGRSLEMLSTWSRNLETLDETLRDAQARSALGMQRNAERRNEDQLLRQTPRINSDPTRLDTDERYYVDRTIRQVERVVAAATSTLRSFASPPGRKVLLLLSGGWPFDPVQYVIDDIDRLVSEPGLNVGEELFSPLSDTANLLGYTIYSVDLAGLQVGAVDASRSPLISSELNSVNSISFYRETDVHNSLNFLARQTGGKALLNAQRDQVFATAVSDTRSFYWLGFTPQRKGDDQRHDVRVEVLRPGLDVRTRDSFFDFSRSREVDMALESALLFGSPPSPQPLVVQVGRPEKAGRKLMLVPIVVAIPTDGITLLPTGPNEYSAEVELRMAVLDEDGVGSGEVPAIPIQFTLREEPAPGGYVRYETGLKMRRKNHDLVVALYDRASGAILSTSVEVSPN